MNLKKKSVVLGVVLSVVMLSVTYAAIVLHKDISTSLVVEANHNLSIIDTDYATVLTAIVFGTLYRGDVATYPSAAPGTIYYIKNTGQADLWLSYSTMSWPSDVSLEMWIKKDPSGSWAVLPISTVTSFSIAPGGYANWYVILTIGSNATFGTYNSTITWNAHDTA